jgi:hypothetical protein
MRWLPAVGLATLWSLSGAFTAQAASVNVGLHSLYANVSGQKVKLNVSGGDLVDALNFFVQIGDGGVAASGYRGTGPLITEVDILTGTIFAGNNSGQTDLTGGLVPLPAEIALVGTDTASGSVTASGLLATLTIDTTGYAAGSTFDLKLKGTLNGDSSFGLDPITITNGSIVLVPVPEPASLMTLVLLAAGFAMFRRGQASRGTGGH